MYVSLISPHFNLSPPWVRRHHSCSQPQEFRPNPSRIIATRHRTVLPASLPRYHIACWGKWANGTTYIGPADEGVNDVIFEVFIEAPTKQVLEMVKYDDAGAKQRGVIAINVSILLMGAGPV